MSTDNTFIEAAKDYARIERALNFIQEKFIEHPSLEEIAVSLNMSKYHFQRVFKRWAGITPIQFMQYLTLDYAKAKLINSRNVFTTTLEVGLSSPSRLHDLFVTFEAMSPHEYKMQGQGLHIRYGFHSSPFGTCLICITKRGICHLSFVEDNQRELILTEVKNSWYLANFDEDYRATLHTVEQLFATDKIKNRHFNLILKGTNFQIKVWEALLAIPLGGLVSYEDIAFFIGNSNATRAAASAIANNSISYLIPCHRVINKTGKIGKYRWGNARKKAIIVWEQSNNS